MISFFILLYLGIGVVLAALAGATLLIAVGWDEPAWSLLAVGIVMWVVVVWWGPIGVMWLWCRE